MTTFSELLERDRPILADGATGTNFQDMGIEPGVAPEEWVFDAPDRVGELHRRFADAGSDLVLTCSFGASSLRLADGPLAGRARELNQRAAQIAREAVGDRGVLVAGSIGPTGQLAEPLGPLGHDEAVAAFAEQAQALAEGGVDLLVLETFFSLDEALWALEAARPTGLPLVASFSFDQGTRTMMGLSAADVVAAIEPLGLAAVGANCGRSLQDNATVLEEYVATGTTIPLWIKPNAGVPQVVGDAVVYPEDPASFAQTVATFAARGAAILGGCCGSTPQHLAALAHALGREPVGESAA